jgi:hypothetical protein
LPLNGDPTRPEQPQEQPQAVTESPIPSGHRMTRGVAVGLLILVAIGTTQAALTGTARPRPATFDEQRYELWATNLYAHGFYGESAFTNLAKTELRSVPYSAYVPPGYPFVLVTLKELHVDRPGVRRGIQAALVGLVILTVGLISLRLFGPVAALLSGVLLIVTGVLPTYAQFSLTEVWATATMIFGLAFVMVGWQRQSWRWLTVGGLILGYSILVRPQALLLPVLLGAYVFFAGGRRRRAALLAGVVIVASYAVVAPWTIRNYLRLHAFVPVASYTWYNFWEVNNPLANGDFVIPERKIPALIREIRTKPEVQEDTALRDLALAWVRAHPVQAAKGWVRDVVFYVSKPDGYTTTFYTLHGWRPPRLDDRVPIAMGLVSFMIAFVAPRKWPSLGILVMVLAYFLVFFAFFLPITRYRVPLVPVYAILAGGLPAMAKRLIDEARHRRTAHLVA